MKKRSVNTVRRVALSLFIPFGIFLCISAGLILLGHSECGDASFSDDRFSALEFDDSGIPPLRPYTARDGTSLSYRYYPAEAETAVILLHGSGGHSRYFMPLASHLSEQNIAQVYTPDLRGHGVSPKRRGDVDYIDQLEDDLADLVAIAAGRAGTTRIVVGGHSSGGGLAIRFGGTPYGRRVDGYILLSPYLRYDAPTIRERSGGWANAHVGRIIGLTLLNNLGVQWFDDLEAICFNLPAAYRDGTETLSYSHRLNTGLAPRDYRTDLPAVREPILAVVGDADAFFVAEAFEPELSKYVKAEVHLLPGVNHLGIVTGAAVRPVLAAWIQSLGDQGAVGAASAGAVQEKTSEPPMVQE